MIDEFEASPHRTQILEMLMASNRRGKFGQSLRSNSAQGSVKVSYNVLPWFSAIEMKKDKQAESNRYVTFELESRKGKGRFEIPSTEEEFSVLRNRSIATLMKTWKKVLPLNEFLVKSMIDGYTRQEESYCLASAVYGAVHGWGEDRTLEWHRSLMKDLKEETVIDEEEESEQELVLNAIMNSQVRTVGGHTYTVSQLLQMSRNFERNGMDPEVILRSNGIRRYSFSEVQDLTEWKRAYSKKKAVEDSYVFFGTAASGSIRRVLLRDTPQSRQDVSLLLSRLSGAFRANLNVNNRMRGVMVPASLVESVDSAPNPHVEMDADLQKAVSGTG